MSHLDAVPVWVAVPAAVLLVVGAGLTLLGAIGLVRFPTFYERIHAPTLGTSWGAGAIILASIIVFSSIEGRAVVHEVLIGFFVTLTTPVTLMLLARATLYRERSSK